MAVNCHCLLSFCLIIRFSAFSQNAFLLCVLSPLLVRVCCLRNRSTHNVSVVVFIYRNVGSQFGLVELSVNSRRRKPFRVQQSRSPRNCGFHWPSAFLPGSSHGRTTLISQKKRLMSQQHLGPLLKLCVSVAAKLVSRLIEKIDRDYEFLEAEKIMDYSLMVGIHFRDDYTGDMMGLSPFLLQQGRKIQAWVPLPCRRVAIQGSCSCWKMITIRHKSSFEVPHCDHATDGSCWSENCDAEAVDRDENAALLSLVKAFDSVLAVNEGYCNLGQIWFSGISSTDMVV